MGLDWQYYHWHLEPSSKCTLKCPRCPRTEFPKIPWINKDMTLEMVQKFLTPKMLSDKVRRITMCGDVGDPIYCKEFVEICKYIKTTNPKIHVYIITNGSHKSVEWWESLAVVLNDRDSINFSVDGYDQFSNNLYRVNAKFDSIVNGIKAVRGKNKEVFLNWATIVFAFNQHHLTNMQQQAKDLGCDNFQITKSTKFGSKYGAWGGPNDVLEPSPEWVSSTHRYERSMISLSGRVQDNVDYLAHNKERYFKIAELYKDKPITPLCAVGNRGIYVNAAGNVYPCSWTSFPYTSLSANGKTIDFADSFFSKNLNEFNVNTRSLSDIVTDPRWGKCQQNFDNVSKTWVECSQKCSTGVVDEAYAVGWETN
jgi:MoaA/NifB/PqqE/SkfB family radical SAM enzyme